MEFPSVTIGKDHYSFFPHPYICPEPIFASLAFVWHGDQILVSDIKNRGWCIPSGRVEDNESPKDAAIREVFEEANVSVKVAETIGYFRIRSSKRTMWATAFVASCDKANPFTPTSESLERKFLSISELPTQYYNWNPLYEAVFLYSYQKSLSLEN